MTQDQLNHVKQVLADFKSSKVAKISSDRRLELAEEKGIPYDTVKGWYPIYMQYGSRYLAKQIGINEKHILSYFRKYNLPLRGRGSRGPDRCSRRGTSYHLRADKVTQKHRDTLVLSYTEWNEKYETKSKSLYYKTKKTFSKYLQDQNL